MKEGLHGFERRVDSGYTQRHVDHINFFNMIKGLKAMLLDGTLHNRGFCNHMGNNLIRKYTLLGRDYIKLCIKICKRSGIA